MDSETGLGKLTGSRVRQTRVGSGCYCSKEEYASQNGVWKQGRGQEHKSKSILKCCSFWEMSSPFVKGLKKGISNQQWSVISQTASDFNSMSNTTAVTLL